MEGDFSIGGESTDAVISGAPDTPASVPAGGAPATGADESISSEIDGLGAESQAPASVEDEIDAALEGKLPQRTVPSPVQSDEELGEIDAEQIEPNADPNKTTEADGQPKPGDEATGELPEGVKVRKLDGKPVWAVDPEKGKEVFARSKAASTLEEFLGEPLTEGEQGSIAHITGAMRVQEHMRSDLISADPAEQMNFVIGCENIIRTAMQRGEIGHNALESLVKTVFDGATAEDSDTADAMLNHVMESPKVMAKFAEHFYLRALRMDEQSRKNPQVFGPDGKVLSGFALDEERNALWAVGQWIDQLTGGNLRDDSELKFLLSNKATELPTYGRKPAQKTSSPQGQPAQATQPQGQPAADAAYKTWTSETGKAITADSVKPALDDLLKKSVSEQAMNALPTVTTQMRSALHGKLVGALQKDTNFQEQMAALDKRAKVAVSPEIHESLKKQMVQRHIQAVKHHLPRVQGPVLTEFVPLFKMKSDQNVQRAAAGAKAGRQAPPSGGPSAARITKPAPKTGFASNSAIEDEIEAAFAGVK